MNTPELASKKVVSFGDVNIDITTYEIDSISSRYRNNIWYTKREMRIMYKKRENDIGKLKNGGKVSNKRNHNQLCVRGLENQIDETNLKQSKKNTLKSIRAVLREQECQQSKGIYDPYTIAKMYYINGAKLSQKKAQEMGKKDYEEIIPIIMMIDKDNDDKEKDINIYDQTTRKKNRITCSLWERSGRRHRPTKIVPHLEHQQ